MSRLLKFRVTEEGDASVGIGACEMDVTVTTNFGWSKENTQSLKDALVDAGFGSVFVTEVEMLQERICDTEQYINWLSEEKKTFIIKAHLKQEMKLLKELHKQLREAEKVY
jgi:hypothetical protein